MTQAAPLHPDRWDFATGDDGRAIILIEGVDTSGTLDAVTTVAGRVWPVGSPDQAVALTGAVLDSAARTVYLNVGTWLAGVSAPGSFDDPDEYLCRVFVTTAADGTRQHPERGAMDWRVWLSPTVPA